MITANNGILIVALTMALGMHTGDHLLMGLAFALAGVSYLVNLAHESVIPQGLNAPLFWGAFLLGLVTYGVVFGKLFGVS